MSPSIAVDRFKLDTEPGILVASEEKGTVALNAFTVMTDGVDMPNTKTLK